MGDQSIKINYSGIKVETEFDNLIKSEELILNDVHEEEDCSKHEKKVTSHSNIGNKSKVEERGSEFQTKDNAATTHVEEANECLYGSVNEFDEKMYKKRLKLDPELQRHIPSFNSETSGEAIPRLPSIKRELSEVPNKSEIPPEAKIPIHGHVSTTCSGRPNQLIACAKCDKKFTCKYTLASHERTHTGDLFICAHCPFKTAYKCSLAIHMVSHTGSYHCCTECPKKFCSKTRLKDHVASKHDRLLNFSCSLCPAKFACQQNLSSHMSYMKKRDSQKHKECTKCSYKARYDSELRVHTLTHEEGGGRPYPCQQCAYAARTLSNLHSHVASVHKPRPAIGRRYPCHMCYFVSDDVLKLANHIDSAHSAASSSSPRLEGVSP